MHRFKNRLNKKHLMMCTVLFLAVIQPALAETDTLEITELDLVGLYNPLGLSVSVKSYQRRVYRHDPLPLWDGLYYQLGGQALVTPAFSRAGVHAEWLPIAILKLRAQIDRLYFSGAFGSLLTFNTANESFDDDVIENREGEERSGYGNRSSFQITLQTKHQHFIVRNITEQVHYQFPGSGPYYLERENELLLARSDSVLSNQIYVLYETKTPAYQRMIGPYHSYVSVDKSGNKSERLGLTWYQQFNKKMATLNNARWYLQAGKYLQEPNRKDEVYLLLGIGGDF